MKNYFLKTLLLLAIISISGCNLQSEKAESELFKAKQVFDVPKRPAGQKDVLELKTEPIDTVRMAIIGLGMRGSGAVYRYNFIEGAKVLALCDVVPEYVERAQKMLIEAGNPET